MQMNLNLFYSKKSNMAHLQKGFFLYIYSRAMKTQHQNVHQYLKDILKILSQRISGNFMNTKDKHHTVY